MVWRWQGADRVCALVSGTRAIIDAIHSGSLSSAKTTNDTTFGFGIITECPNVPSEILVPRNAWAGKAAYDRACQSCHGPDGTPNPAIAKMLKVEMKDLKSAEIQALSDEDMKKIIAEGKGKMKPVKTVSGPAVEDVIAYVRSLKK
jgi:cytochrome c553